jgi:hypothetical protein
VALSSKVTGYLAAIHHPNSQILPSPSPSLDTDTSKTPFLKTTPASDTGFDIDPHNNNTRLHSKAKRILKKAEATRAPE